MSIFSKLDLLEVKASKEVYYKYYSRFRRLKEDFLFAGYIHILENKDKLLGLVNKDRYDKMVMLAGNGMAKFNNDS